MQQKVVLAAMMSAMLVGVVPAVSFAQATVKEEFAEHPQIRTAVRELEAAIAYMEKAPHNFGGHKAKAIADSRAAIGQLRAAMAYRANVENKKY